MRPRGTTDRIPALRGAFPARFRSRPNRFLLRCVGEGGEGALEAFLPNPGRLRELLLPDVRLWLVPVPPRVPPRKTAFTAVAVERDGVPVFLHTHLNNEVARRLLDGGGVPGLEGARVLASEVSVGRSRFDFLVARKGREMLVEVKSVTLFGGGVAMFPDAVTARGRRHLMELAALRAEGRDGAVLFLAHGAGLAWFMPDYHTDLAFARTLVELRERLPIHAVSVGWSADLCHDAMAEPLVIPWDALERELHDRGLILCIFRLDGDGGGPAGWALVVEDCADGLSRRVEAIRRRRRAPRGAAEELRAVAAEVELLPIRGDRPDGEALREDLAALFGPCLDLPLSGGTRRVCFSAEDPLDRPSFHRLLEAWRMALPLRGGSRP